MTELRIDDFHHSFILLATDGLFRVMSGQEAVDIVKETNDAQRGAETVVHKAIFEYGTPDDTTAMVIPLMGWGNYHSQLYTPLLRDVRVTDVFGLPILEIPKNLIPVLDRPDHTQSDVLLTLFSLLDTGGDGRLCAEDIRMACIGSFGRGLLRSRFSALAPALVPVRSFAVDFEDGTQLHTYHATREEDASPSPPAQRLQYTSFVQARQHHWVCHVTWPQNEERGSIVFRHHS